MITLVKQSLRSITPGLNCQMIDGLVLNTIPLIIQGTGLNRIVVVYRIGATRHELNLVLLLMYAYQLLP